MAGGRVGGGSSDGCGGRGAPAGNDHQGFVSRTKGLLVPADWRPPYQCMSAGTLNILSLLLNALSVPCPPASRCRNSPELQSAHPSDWRHHSCPKVPWILILVLILLKFTTRCRQTKSMARYHSPGQKTLRTVIPVPWLSCFFFPTFWCLRVSLNASGRCLPSAGEDEIQSCVLSKATQLVSGRGPWSRYSTSRGLLKCKGSRDMQLGSEHSLYC